MNDNENFEGVRFGFDREHVVGAVIPQATVHDEDVLLVALRIGHHLRYDLVIIVDMSSDDTFDGFGDFVRQRASGILIGVLQCLDLRKVQELADLILDELGNEKHVDGVREVTIEHLRD